MAALPVEEVRSRVEADFDRIVNVLNEKIALQSISAKGITADHMKRSAEFVAEELSKVGVNAQVVQSHNPNGTPGAWEVIGSKIVDEDAPTVLLYAHHDVQPVPDASAWNTDPFVGTVSTPDCTGAARPTMVAASPSIQAHCRPSATI